MDLRQKKSVRFSKGEIPTEFQKFAEMELLPALNFSGYKIPAKKEIAVQIFRNLIIAGLKKWTVADSRDNSINGLRSTVWDAVKEAGFCTNRLGSEKSEKVTRYSATDKLLEIRDHWKLRLLCVQNSDLNLIVWKPEKDYRFLFDKKDWNVASYLENTCRKSDDIYRIDYESVAAGLEYWRGIEDLIEKINRNNSSFSWSAERRITSVDGTERAITMQPNVMLREIHTGDMFHGYVRLYTFGELGAQSLSKSQRVTIKIDGESTVEIDFVSSVPRICYHMSRIPVEGDIYRPKEIFPIFGRFKNKSEEKWKELRNVAKKVFNIMLNTPGKNEARGAVFKLYNDLPKKIKSVISNTEKMAVPDLLERVELTHPELKKHGYFYANNGAKMMRIEFQIMRQILLKFAEENKPCLGIHDAIIVKESDIEMAQETMREMYFKYVQFGEPELKIN